MIFCAILRRRSLLCTFLLGSFGISIQASAQETPAAAADADALRSSDIVVTAQRRTERLQDVPITITTITAADLKRANIRTFDSVQSLTPGLTSTTGCAYPQTYIRGMGSTFPDPRLEQAVAAYADAAYLPRSAGALLDAIDVQSVEAFRGPQGEL